MKILIIGANGFLGPAIAASAASKGQSVYGLSRSRHPGRAMNATCLQGDRRSPDSILELVENHDIHAVIDVIAMTESDTSHLLTTLDGQIGQYVMLSSCDVYRNYELLQKTAAGEPVVTSIDEGADLRTTRYPYRGPEPRPIDASDRHLDDYDKIPIEEKVRELSSDWTILRLPMIYGPDDRQRRFRWAIEPMAAGEASLTIPRAWAEWVTTYAYVENVAEAITVTLGHTGAARRVFNVGEASPADHLEWARRIAEVMGKEVMIQPSDDLDTPFARRLGTLDLTVPLRIDDSAIRRELAFREIVDLETTLERTIADELGRADS